MRYILTFFLLQLIIFSQTKSQLKEAKKIIKERGMSKKEVLNKVKEYGVTEKQINSAIQNDQELDQVEKINNDLDIELVDDDQADNKKKIDEEESIIEKNKDKNILFENKNQSGYFGYDIFANDPSLFQSASVGTADPSYSIGPGDEIIVMLWGETQFRQMLTVDREGFVFIPEIGQVSVNGLNLSLLESKLFRVFSQSYASLNPLGGSPTTFLDVSLGNLRPLRIQVIGEVSQPGAYTVSPTATLFSSLYYFNGPTNSGSLRDIQLIRNGEKIASIDFYDYLLTGKKIKDQKLQLDDIIYIPRRIKSISIKGEINREGIFELKNNEGLNDLIKIAGGLKITAFLNRTQIDRIVPFKNRTQQGPDRYILDLNLDEVISSKQFVQMNDGDKVEIFPILDAINNMVSISGAVVRPGNYDIGKSMTISQLLEKAGGVLGDAILEKIDILRTNSDYTEKLINLDLTEINDDENVNNLVLQGGDIVKLYGMKKIQSLPRVLLTGFVKKPGLTVLKENMTVYDLIFQDSGLIDDEFRKNIYMERADLIRLDSNNITKTIIPLNIGNILNDKLSDENLRLKSNDELKIYSQSAFNLLRSVSIEGFIKNPGKYTLKSNMKIKDLIIEAGGVTEDLYKYKLEISRINPNNLNETTYAEILEFEMLNDYSIINYDYELKDELRFDLKNNILLRPYDVVTVRADPYFNLQRKVEINGEVHYPGSYTISNSVESIHDLVKRAGGIRPNAFIFGSVFIRNDKIVKIDLEEILKRENSKLDIPLQSGDKLIINKKPKTIMVSGEVNSPGNYKFIPGQRLNDVIKIAGGLTENAEKDNIYVKYANGVSKKYLRWFKNPKIYDGSIINVGLEEEVEPIDKTEFAKELTNIIANFAQVISVIYLATK